MFVAQKSLNGRHLATAYCQRGAERKRNCLEEEEAWVGTEMALTAFGIPLTMVYSFKYLGQVLAVEYDDWPAVVRNLQHARQKWARLNRILSREGADARTSGHIYLAVVQSVMLYGSESWVLTLCMKRVLGRFHHRVARRLTGRQPRRGREGGWVYPPVEDVMAEAVLQEVETYVSHQQNTVTQYIATRPIMDLCLAAKWSPGPRVVKRWWEQEVLYLVGIRMAAWEAEHTEGGKEMDGTGTYKDY